MDPVTGQKVPMDPASSQVKHYIVLTMTIIVLTMTIIVLTMTIIVLTMTGPRLIAA
jgi:hypothetical protein